MRFKDYIQMFAVSLGLGFFLSIIFYFIWSDAYKGTTNSFWMSMFGVGVLCLPIGYWSVKQESTCSQCGEAFVLSTNGQEDIENFVKYKNERVMAQHGTSSYYKDVPYNVRRYYQYMKCDNCGHEYRYETKDESKA